jgi:hypothetical protein
VFFALLGGMNDTTLVFNMVFKLRTKVFEHASHGHRSRITQSTNGSPHDVFCHVVQHLQIALPTFPVFNPVDHP